MSQRTEDQGFITMLRETEARLKRLESTNNSVRRNDIRLGNLIVTPDAQNNRLCVENLETGAVNCFDREIAIFTAPGEGGGWFPSYPAPSTTTATEILVSMVVPDADDIVFDVYFNDEQFMKTVTLLAGETLLVVPINIPVIKNARITAEATIIGAVPDFLTVIVRFGSTTIDRTLNEV